MAADLAASLMFRPKSRTGSEFSFRLEGDAGFGVLSARAKKLTGPAPIKFDDWASNFPTARSAISQLQATLEAGDGASDGALLAEVRGDEVWLHPDELAVLDAASAAALQLPPATSLALDLQSEKLVTDADFVVRSRWIRPGGGGVRHDIRGACINYDGLQRRIPEPLYSLWKAAKALSVPANESDRFAALSRLQELLPDQARDTFVANGYLGDTRIHYASAFSLKLGRADPFDFDPVLFGPASARRAADEEAAVDEEESVLSPRAQRVFAEDRFRASREIRPTYVLKDGDYVYIDPALRPALKEVRALQSAPADERRAFVTNPRRTLRQRLGDEVADKIGVDDLFLETEQFSARVAGIDVWTKPVLPWLKQAPNTWLPEKFGLRVGDQYIELQPERIIPLAAAVDEAMRRGEPTAHLDDLKIPANEQSRAALGELRPFVQAPGDGVAEGGAPFGHELARGARGRFFLLVTENFEEVEFAPFAPTDLTSPIEFGLPKRLKATLKPHQIDGVKWLVEAAIRQRSGALLADDMGLGKTLQAIAFMAWLQDQAAEDRRAKGPFLVVAPTGLLANWRSEIERHLQSPYLGDVVLAFGGGLKSLREEDAFGERDIASGRAALQGEAWRNAGVVLTTYETLRDYHISFAKWPFELVIFDEIQKLKNPTSQLTRAAKTLNPHFVLGMTGTPVENRLQDLWSIMDVLAPGLLGSSKDFDRRYPSTDEKALRGLRAQLADRHAGMPPFMLRRMKADHLPGLPEKFVHSKRIEMPPVQAQAYEGVVRRAIAGKAGFSKSDGMLQVLHAMRGISLHPIDPDDAPADLEAYAAQSARLSWTLEILKSVQEKREKALVFVESLAMQARLASLIQTRFGLPHPPPRIHGGVPGLKRQEIVNAFQARPGVFDVMLLSPKAGGVGLTITEANHVIHLSRWWNPAVEDQSTDRVFRIGQTKPVNVYLPLAVHGDPVIGPSSFDVRLNDLLERKRGLSRDMLLPPEGSDDDIGALFEAVSSFDGQSKSEDASDAEDQAPSPADQSTPQPLGEPNAAPIARPILTLPNTPAPLLPRVWRCAPRQARPLAELLRIFENARISVLEISDPYAIAGIDARVAQARFVKALLESAQSINQVTIEYRPPRDDDSEGETQQRRDMAARWNLVLGAAANQCRLSLSSRRKTPERDFHDRFVFVNCTRAGGATARHELQLGKGLISLMEDRHECSITYVPPTF